MDCRTCQNHFAERSVELLPLQAEVAFDEHVKKCPPCDREWQAFQRILFVVSTANQPLPSGRGSSEMWSACSEHVFDSIESKRVKAHQASPWLGWMRSSTLGWATLGGALLVLGSVWWLTPQDNGQQYTAEEQYPGTLVQFQQPPAVASDMVNNHAAMGFDPFADRVGSTMVSYSATNTRQ